ncbi:hypothetical protein KNV19_gp46 [Gordonia phage Portcullis]|uniref:Uncharacterized protein n=2 Tax=Wizardvirus TaxID=2169658 RepID=A0A7G8LGI8_9CAUD|nr:hypothetical protein KNV19_gp46 [Gordonia phage Portcullis]QNJ56360.1 hypothetical protein SEA_PORTCULLIS_46 [Gordonia phage Portcullis]WNO27962.1 hypothetical protein SEA_HALO3_45 [Gordonia phage Halo3]
MGELTARLRELWRERFDSGPGDIAGRRQRAETTQFALIAEGEDWVDGGDGHVHHTVGGRTCCTFLVADIADMGGSRHFPCTRRGQL